MDQTWNPMWFEFRNTLGLGHVLESHPWDRLWVETARKEERKKERSQMRFKFWKPMPVLAGSITNFNILISYRHHNFFLSFVHIDMIQVWGLSSFSAGIFTHPEGFTLHKNVCRDPQYEVWTSVGIVSCKKLRYQPGIDDLRISYPT